MTNTTPPAQARYRLAAVTSHPVQYHAPLFQQLASHPRIDLTVFYGDDRSVAGGMDEGFGRQVSWDRPLLDGYSSVVLRRLNDRAGAFGRLASELSIVRHLWRGGFDAVFIHSYATRLSLLAYIGSILSGTPVLLRTESEQLRPRPAWINLVKTLLLKPLLTVTTGVLVIGEANRRFYEGLRIRVRQFFTPYSVDNNFFLQERSAAESSRTDRRRTLGWSDDVVVVGFSGKLVPGKGVDLLVDAVAALQGEGLRLGLLLIGDGPERAALEERVRSRGLTATVFDGFRNQSELALSYVCLDVFVLPSRAETWGLVLNEAMLFGLPVIATDRTGASLDLIEPGVNGYVVPVDEVGALIDALRTLVTSSERRLEFGRRSEAIIRRYSYDTCVQGILDALGWVAKRPRAAAHDPSARGVAA